MFDKEKKKSFYDASKKCKQCKQNVCLCNNEVCTYAYKKYGMKRWVYGIIITVISLGLIIPFFSEAICTIWFPNVTLGLNTWNQFVSIILGVIATLLSIVSMIMGFKNYDDTLYIQEKYTQTLKDIGHIAKDLDSVRQDVSKILLSASSQVNEKTQSEGSWGNEPQQKT